MSEDHFPKRVRLLRGCDFERVFAARASAGDASLVVHGAQNGLDHPRLGLAVSRAKGSAPQRNRWKRVLREVFRRAKQELPPLDLVCVPKTGAVPDFDRLADSLPRLAKSVHEKLRRRGQTTPRRDQNPEGRP